MGESVLLVGDDGSNSPRLGRALAGLGFQVLTAASGREALAVFEDFHPGLVVTELAGPGLDGLDLLRRIKAGGNHAQVILLARPEEVDLAVQGLKLDASDFVLEPVKPEALEVALQRARQRRDLLALREGRPSPAGSGAKPPAACSRPSPSSSGGMTPQHYAQLFDAAPCYISVQNRDLRLTATNRRFKEDFGPEIGEPCYKIYKHRDQPCDPCPVQKTFADGQSHSSEEVVATRNGERHNILVYTAPIRDEAGEIVEVMEMATDVTEMRRLQDELGFISQRYQQLFNAVPCYISVQDRNLFLTDTNRLFKEDFGPELGRHCYKIYKHRDEPCSPCPIQKTFEDGRSQSSEEIVTTLNGQRHNILVYTAPIRDETGEIVEVMEMATNVTEMRRLQDRFFHLGQRYQQLFDEVPCYISVQNRDLILTATNRQFKEDFGPELGRHCYQIYKHRSEPCSPCPVQRTFEDGLCHSSEEIVTTQAEEPRNILVYTAPIRNEAGEIVEVMEMATDITEIRRLQDHLSSLGLLLGSVSHGVKGLLTALDGGLYQLKSGLVKRNWDQLAEGLEVVKLMVGRIRNMVLDILYFAKKRDLKWEWVDVLTFAQDLATTVEPKMKQHGIDFIRDFDASAGGFEIDSGVVHSALVNILENAVDACVEDRTKDRRQVLFAVLQDERNVIFTIKDNGVGIDRETMEKMFTLFFSSKGTKGTGLGLFVSHKIIEQHGGSIKVYSKPRQGTTFRVVLPKRRIGAEEPGGAVQGAA